MRPHALVLPPWGHMPTRWWLLFLLILHGLWHNAVRPLSESFNRWGPLAVPIHYWVAVIAYCSVIFWLSHNPEPPGVEIRFAGKDKIAHTVMYGGLAGLVGVGMRRSRRLYGHSALFYVPVLVAAGYGLLDEIHQLFVPLRSFDPWDLAADAGGAILVSWALLRWWPPGDATPEELAG